MMYKKQTPFEAYLSWLELILLGASAASTCWLILATFVVEHWGQGAKVDASSWMLPVASFLGFLAIRQSRAILRYY